MFYKALRSLTKKQREDIKELLLACEDLNEFQESQYRTEMLQKEKNLHCFFLAYEADCLVSALFLLCYGKEEAEVLAYTKEDKRRQGNFTKLMDLAKSDLMKAGVCSYVFLLKPEKKEEILSVLRVGAVLESSEYLLRYNNKNDFLNEEELRQLQQEVSAHLCDAQEDDRKALQPIYESMFSSKEKTAALFWLDENLQSPEILIYKLVKGKELLGTASVIFDDMTACIFALGVDQTYRGCGYGKLLLLLLLKELKNSAQEIILQVNSRSGHAIYLYQTYGFIITEQLDCYRGG